MPIYGYKSRAPELNYFADVRSESGGLFWEHIRTNLGRKVAYAMIAKHHSDCKIVSFRDDSQATEYDRQGLESSDGVLLINIWAGYCTAGESYATAR